MVEAPIALANTIRQRLLEKQEAEEAERIKKEKEKAEKIKKIKTEGKQRKKYKLEEPVFSRNKWCTYSPSIRADWHYRQGCVKPLKNWLNSSADLLFVIGFCVIGFLKFIFLSILHYEIREMIQKIHVLENENVQLNGGLAAVLGLGEEIQSVTSSDGNKNSRSSSPSCHSSQSLHPPQTANTIISFPVTEKSSNCNAIKQDKMACNATNTRNSATNNLVGELINNTMSNDKPNTNFIQMNPISTNQIIAQEQNDYSKAPHSPGQQTMKNPDRDCHAISNINTYPNRMLNLETQNVTRASLPPSHDIVNSSTATTAQSSSESTINKQAEWANRSSEASILSPNSEGWPLRHQNYFQDGSEHFNVDFEANLRGDKCMSEHRELVNKQNHNKCDFSINPQSRTTTANVNKQSTRNDQHPTSDYVCGDNMNNSFCTEATQSFSNKDYLVHSSFRSGNGGSSKQTAI